MTIRIRGVRVLIVVSVPVPPSTWLDNKMPQTGRVLSTSNDVEMGVRLRSVDREGGQLLKKRGSREANRRMVRDPWLEMANPWTPSTSSRLDCVRRRARNRPRTIERTNG
jgi:hypothetical protein